MYPYTRTNGFHFLLLFLHCLRTTRKLWATKHGLRPPAMRARHSPSFRSFSSQYRSNHLTVHYRILPLFCIGRSCSSSSGSSSSSNATSAGMCWYYYKFKYHFRCSAGLSQLLFKPSLSLTPGLQENRTFAPTETQQQSLNGCSDICRSSKCFAGT